MRRNRLPLVLLMAGSLVVASLWRQSTPARAARGDRTATTQPGSVSVGSQDFGQFNSYTLGLLLGGLRGPLVMTLWSSSETQKSERNLDDINTKIELIGMLQPEFDTVHLFQIWNKAYNLSVQMSNLPSKYATILDAIEYANKRRGERSQNINLESGVASIYFDKLGNSSEKAYYRERVREETIAPLGQVKFVFPPDKREDFIRLARDAGADSRRYTIRPEGGQQELLTARLRADYADRVIPQFKGDRITTETIAPRVSSISNRSIRTSLDPMLDAKGNILPQFATRGQSASTNDLDWRPQDGELSYLVRFEPFPYGVSPYALAYNYYKRSVSLQETLLQKHAQLSERVISSRPALSLKQWSEEELDRGRLAEMAQFGFAAQAETEAALPYEMPAAALTLEQLSKTPLIEESIYSYNRAADLALKAVSEYDAHIQRYRDDSVTYVSHKAHSKAISELAKADSLYLQAGLASGDDRKRLATEAASHYNRAIALMSLNILAFYTPEEILEVALPKGYGKTDMINAFENAAAFPEQNIAPAIETVYRITDQPEFPAISEIQEYRTYSARAFVRLQGLEKLLGS